MSKLRADAVRSRRLILDTARSLIDKEGPTVSFDTIARAAGVGSATLYRHFPTRIHLLEAAFEERLDDLKAQAKLLRESPGADTLHRWANRLLRETIARHGLGAAVLTPQVHEEHPVESACRTEIVDVTREVLEGAPSDADDDAQARAQDLVDVITGIALIVGGDEVRGERLLGVWLAGLAAQAQAEAPVA